MDRRNKMFNGLDINRPARNEPKNESRREEKISESIFQIALLSQQRNS